MEPAIVALRTHVLGLVDAEIERAHKRGDHSPETEAALRHLAGVLLHEPSNRARELALENRAQDFADGIEIVYGIPAPLAADAADETAESA